MSIEQKLGETKLIICEVVPYLVIEDKDELLPLEPEDYFNGAIRPPENCPRGSRFDSRLALGCLSCVNAKITLTNHVFAEISSPNL